MMAVLRVLLGPYLLHYYCTSFEKRSTVLEKFFLFPFLGFAIHVQYRPRGVFQIPLLLFLFVVS